MKDPGTISRDERELIDRLRELYDEYERINRKLADATHRQRYSPVPEEVERARLDEGRLLQDLTATMDRLGVIEGHLMRIRKRVRPVLH
jgi:cobalamin-dependent methionine synthase I